MKLLKERLKELRLEKGLRQEKLYMRRWQRNEN